MLTEPTSFESLRDERIAQAKRLANRLLKFLPLLSALGFGFTAVTIASLFSLWNLNFAQLADPADVIFPGLLLIIFMPLGPVGAFTSSAFIDLALVKASQGLRHQVTTAIVVGVPLATLALVNVPCVARPVRDLCAAGGVLLAIGGAWSVLRDAFSGKARGWIARTASCCIAVFATVAYYNAAVQLVSKTGLVSGLVVRKAGDKIPCDGKVLWLGAKSVVIRCAVDRPTPKAIIVLGSRDGLVLYPIPPSPTEATPAPPPATGKAPI